MSVAKKQVVNTASKFKFVDLFSGLGGFHTALSDLGMECVFASEIDESLRNLYLMNYGILPAGDIRKVPERNIPSHDVLCAGFPCQPFSIAGRKKGAKCPVSGKLIDDVLRIAKFHKPKYVFLENVPHILTIEDGKFWNYIRRSFKKMGYKIEHKIYSAVEFGIPQKRKRLFAIAYRDKEAITWPEISDKFTPLLQYTKNTKDENIRVLEKEKVKALKVWQKIITSFPILSSHTIVASEFGATYPLDKIHRISLKEVKKYKGAFGQSLKHCDKWSEVLSLLPHYIDPITKKPANWLHDSLINTRELYRDNKITFDQTIKAFKTMPQSWQKMQWQGCRKKPSIWKNLIQFRASGVRIIRPEIAPSLVAMTPTQIPILGYKKEYLSPRSGASLQGLEKLKHLPSNHSKAFKAIGNAVNAKIVTIIFQSISRKE